MEHLRKAHFNQAPQFSWTDLREPHNCHPRQIAGATEHLVSISLGIVFAAEMASTTVSRTG